MVADTRYIQYRFDANEPLSEVSATCTPTKNLQKIPKRVPATADSGMI